ncbi:Aspartyl/glutamyl-tRNA(Asn/Gln) amidotransferase subunit B [Smittium mucronatum]|uniref:Aspartyl/glutamyl-tRNA(Asn/Gln) amidotransferase subunit B n=1 Tax=Smittium mucronatum TaxID=133383 RepID=A0A1R0GR17_9FUNG|nr:Aspartyl/glutamyl-tRNA(Asn/Gln) amidotransferase subunit B [Smittium mucronatum]
MDFTTFKSLQKTASIIQTPGSSTNKSIDLNNYGIRVEVKNLNSLKSVSGAIESEIKRQSTCLHSGLRILSETRSFDSLSKLTKATRSKESAPDYRFMPEADIPIIHLSDEWINYVSNSIPELFEKTKSRLKAEYGLSSSNISVLYKFPKSVQFFEHTCQSGADPRKAFSW